MIDAEGWLGAVLVLGLIGGSALIILWLIYVIDYLGRAAGSAERIERLQQEQLDLQEKQLDVQTTQLHILTRMEDNQRQEHE